MKPSEPPSPPRSAAGASGRAHSSENAAATAGGFRAAATALLRRAWRWRLRWLLGLTLVLGLGAAVGAGLWMAATLEDEAQAEFAGRASDLADQLHSRVRAYTDLVYSLRGFMNHAPTPEIRRDEFHRFVNGLAIAERYPGLTNISFAYHVARAGRPAFERRMRGEYEGLPGLPPFEIKPPGERADYEVVSYMEPLTENAVAIGLDLSTDPVRYDAVRRARDSGMLATTAGLTLLRDSGAPTTSVLLRLAVYDGDIAPRTLEARRLAYAGVAGVAIRLQQMFEAAVSDEQRKRMRLMVTDVTDAQSALGEARPAGSLLFDSLAAARGDASAAVAYAGYGVVDRIGVGDRTWELRISPLYDPKNDVFEQVLPYATAAAVLMITLLLCGLLQSLATAKAQGAALRHNVRTLEFHRRRLAETQEIANIGGWEWDVRQHRQVWSDALYRLLGRAVGDPPEPTDEFFITHIVHPEDIALARRALKRVLEDGKPVEIECRVLLPGGEERIVSSVTRLESADDGARTRLVGTVRDITEDHRAAARERAQLVFIQTMMDAIPNPVFQKDPSGHFRACNDAWCRFTGKPRDAIIGHALEDFAPGPHVAAIREHDRSLLARPAASAFEITMPNAAGEPRQLMVHKASYLADDGTIAGLVGVVFDVTDRKLAEHRLQQMVAELDRRNSVATLLGEFGEMLQSCVSMDEAYEAVAKYLPRVMPGSAGALYRVNPAYGRGERVAGWGAAASSSALAADDCVAVRRGRARNVADSAQELNCRHFDAGAPRAYACLPLTAQGELIGLLHVERAEAGPEFDAGIGWPALMTAAEHVALAVANLSLRESLREQATHDKLTGLYNRHYLNARFEQELARAKRMRLPAAAIMLDIDHFKRFNDTFGHAAGDHVLRELARVVSRFGRKSDVACRYGGEEFVLFLPETSAEVAFGRAEAIREAIKALQLEWEGQALGCVTVSAGVAAYPEHGDDPDSLLRVADRALYQAKETGRDRVVRAPATPAVLANGPAPMAR